MCPETRKASEAAPALHANCPQNIGTTLYLIIWALLLDRIKNGTENVANWNSEEGKGQNTCCSAAYKSQTRDQQRFTISEVAADWSFIHSIL